MYESVRQRGDMNNEALKVVELKAELRPSLRMGNGNDDAGGAWQSAWHYACAAIALLEARQPHNIR